MDLIKNNEVVSELVFLDVWESGLVPTVSGATRVRQLMRAAPVTIARYRSLRAAWQRQDGSVGWAKPDV